MKIIKSYCFFREKLLIQFNNIIIYDNKIKTY